MDWAQVVTTMSLSNTVKNWPQYRLEWPTSITIGHGSYAMPRYVNQLCSLSIMQTRTRTIPLLHIAKTGLLYVA